MPITREALNKRLAELEQQRRGHVDDLNAIAGAIQDVKFWIAQLDAPEQPAEQSQQ